MNIWKQLAISGLLPMVFMKIKWKYNSENMSMIVLLL